jgi:hypothetical protein
LHHVNNFYCCTVGGCSAGAARRGKFLSLRFIFDNIFEILLFFYHQSAILAAPAHCVLTRSERFTLTLVGAAVFRWSAAQCL